MVDKCKICGYDIPTKEEYYDFENSILCKNCYKNKTLFMSYFDKIKSESLRNFAVFLADCIPSYFYYIPASATGKYHPAFSLGHCGLVRHSIVAVDWYESLCRSFEIAVCDEAIFALLFHDSLKSGIENSGYTVPEHPQLAAEFIWSFFDQAIFPKNNDVDMDLVYRLILAHMGIWGDSRPQTQLEKIVHLADFCAAQKIHERPFDEV